MKDYKINYWTTKKESEELKRLSRRNGIKNKL